MKRFIDPAAGTGKSSQSNSIIGGGRGRTGQMEDEGNHRHYRSTSAPGQCYGITVKAWRRRGPKGRYSKLFARTQLIANGPPVCRRSRRRSKRAV
ncbi:hypothetical protein SBA5_360037 [Candidatus Sulfotelmatomonas gaucii]|uniref:Uncharacterized protein n=1 Tax=Candidatus Sulfuritelmatomonas gaucii TaxID=2043161 RepID=A0A2N9LHR8_9BACT|nr:hypothetical protein SBA5_360037 [Candidatus Sulfotelmatomonas gaucii]